MSTFPSATELIIKLSKNETITVPNYLESISTLLIGDQLVADDILVMSRLLYYLGALTFKKGSNTEMKIVNESVRLEFVEDLSCRLKKFLGDTEIRRISKAVDSIVENENPFCEFLTKSIPTFIKFGTLKNGDEFQFGMTFSYCI